MPTIKGPITLGGGKALPKEVLDVVKLPFQAKGWKSKNLQELVEEPKNSDDDDTPTPTVPQPPSTSEEKSDVKIWTREELENLDFLELREIGDKLGVKDRSKRGLIRDILGVQ